MEALNEQFGTSAEFEDPKGGIFLWVKLPDNVDTLKLYQAALAAGVAINRGRNGRPTRPIPAAAYGCALPAPRISKSAKASPAGRSVPQGVRRAGAERECREAGSRFNWQIPSSDRLSCCRGAVFTGSP